MSLARTFRLACASTLLASSALVVRGQETPPARPVQTATPAVRSEPTRIQPPPAIKFSPVPVQE
ncbi:MAG TPA: hypothetical protein VGV59_11025, partial [Pyrinomonadaceae bacterium]|nr:hypothetical protein [Pyrinomonadaceae bacterium]